MTRRLVETRIISYNINGDESMEVKYDIQLQASDTVVVAVSGGPDSMALLSYLIERREQIGFCIICAHVNHNIREQSQEEYDYVQQFCCDHAVTFEGTVFEQYHADNFHQEARDRRYQFFQQVLHKYHAQYLYTAHHGDDLMETVLMRLTRGSSLKGYHGFSNVTDYGTYQVIRPFIGLTKEDLLCYLTEKEIFYYVDASNEKDCYTRNRYRKQVLPFLKQEEPKAHLKFLKYSQLLEDCSSFIGKLVDQFFQCFVSKKQLMIPPFLERHPFLQRQILQAYFERYYETELYWLNDRHMDLIYDMINSAKPNQVISLPHQYEAVKEYQRFFVRKASQVAFSDEKRVVLSSELTWNDGVIQFVTEEATDSNYVCRLASDEITLPLSVRLKRDGDRMSVKGMTGHKKVKDIFINEKVSSAKRSKWPVVVDAKDEIVWLPGLKKSQFNKDINEKYDIILKYLKKEEQNE